MPGRASLDGLKAVGRRPARSLTLLGTATALTALYVPLWAYERRLLGSADPGVRLLVSWPMRLVALLREVARGATVGAAQLLLLDVREQRLKLVGRMLVPGVRDAD
jgi:hypothetical protein